MAEFFASAFWTGFLWPLIVMVAQSVLLLVVLLIAIAYILLADRKIWAAVQIRRGPNVVGPWAWPSRIVSWPVLLLPTGRLSCVCSRRSSKDRPRAQA